MTRDNNRIIDRSGDRKYFTQIPNIIVNHSTAYEQSLYLIMKRLAGEAGSCYASLNWLAGKMGVDKKTVTKTISKLLKRAWISEIEPRKVKGGQVRQFIIVDLWKLNIEEYESGDVASTSKSGGQEDESGSVVPESGCQKDTKKIDTKINNKTLSPKATDFNLQLKVKEMADDKRRDIQVIGLWIEQMKLKPENSQQLSSIVRRNLRPAKLLEGYDNESIKETIRTMQNTEYLKKFTLETTLKFIDQIVASKKVAGPKIIRWEQVTQPGGYTAMRPIYAQSVNQ